MNLKTFQELSKRTMPFGGEPANQVEFENMLGNYAMGLVGETMEFALAQQKGDSDEILKEAGDVLHYCVGLLSCLGEKVDYQLIYESEMNSEALAISMSNILEMPKKHIYHRHELQKDELVKAVHVVIKGYTDSTERELLSEIMQRNIEKLKTRYPDKFSVEDSIKRVDVNG